MRRALAAMLALALPTAAFALTPGGAGADGTEALGPPTVAVASGSGIAVGGTGMNNQPASFAVDVPAGAAVKQVLLYWQQHHCHGAAADDSVTLDGNAIAGTAIGGPTTFFVDWAGCPSVGYVDVSAYRADITGLGLVGAGTTALTAAGLSTGIPTYGNDGAGVLVIYDDGTDAEIAVRDGLDLAYHAFDSPLNTTEPQTFTFAPESSDRVASLPILAGSVDGERPNAVAITIDGTTTKLLNVLESNVGPEWDVVRLPVTIPAGASSLTLQLLSESDGTERNPASFSWVVGALSVPVGPPPPPPPPPSGEGAGTPGYWKNHPEAWPVESLTIGGTTYTKAQAIELMDRPSRKDATLILVQQLIAAKLNLLIGTEPSCISSTVADADALLQQHPPGSGIKPSSGAGQELVTVAGELDAYNNGERCAPSRDSLE